MSNLVTVLKKHSQCSEKGITLIEQQEQEVFLSYKELFDQSLSVLSYLQDKNIGKGDELVFQIENNKDFLILFWGCLMGGIIPVPLSVGRNADHRKKILNIWKILDAPHLIGSEKSIEKTLSLLSAESPDKVLLDDIHQKKLFLHNVFNCKKQGEIVEISDKDIAYIQFSSGSTGTPKGVKLTHQNLVANVNAILNGIDSPDSGDTFFSWMPLTHDMGLIGYHLSPLTAGWNHYLMPTDLFIRRPMLWLKKISEHRLTFTASPNFGYKYVMDRMKESDLDGIDLSSLRIITNGAEPISTKVCEEFLEVFSPYGLKETTMFPVYGLAEACLAVTFSDPNAKIKSVSLNRNYLKVGDQVRMAEGNDGLSFVNLGVAVQDCAVRVVDDNQQELGEGRIGNLEISGINVTSGYYNNPEATANAILPDGWLNTGDLGFINGGDLFVTGRAKDIIFVNGQNYYAHDIERELESIEGVNLGKVAVAGCTHHRTGQEEIVVFLYHKGKVDILLELIREVRHLINQRFGFEPDQVIPVKEIPKTTSGKVQRYRLVKNYQFNYYDTIVREVIYGLKKYQMELERIFPSNDIEKSVFEIWKKVLGHENFGVTDRFFDVGGNSLKSMQFIQMVSQEFKVDLSYSSLFENQTIRSVSFEITRLDKEQVEDIAVSESKGQHLLSMAQSRLFYFWQINADETAYNVPVALELNGQIDRTRLQEAFAEMCHQHEILRTSYIVEGSKPLQIIREVEPHIIQTTRIDKNHLQDELRKRVRPFDLAVAPLLRLELLEISDDRHVLFVDVPHIVLDGVSMNIFLREAFDRYYGEKVPNQEIRYVDFVAWESEDLQVVKRTNPLQYWLNQLGNDLPTLELPVDFARPTVMSYEGAKLEYPISRKLYGQLKNLADSEETSLFALLFAAYNLLLSKYTSQEDIVVGIPATVREHKQLQT
ncbi:MAG: condensation domain-containing protein, partial [Cyclobacteriaceae bacterium]